MDETVKERDLSDLLWVFGCESSTVSVWLCPEETYVHGCILLNGEGGDFPLYYEGEPLFSETVIMYSLICTHILTFHISLIHLMRDWFPDVSMTSLFHLN